MLLHVNILFQSSMRQERAEGKALLSRANHSPHQCRQQTALSDAIGKASLIVIPTPLRDQ